MIKAEVITCVCGVKFAKVGNYKYCSKACGAEQNRVKSRERYALNYANNPRERTPKGKFIKKIVRPDYGQWLDHS